MSQVLRVLFAELGTTGAIGLDAGRQLESEAASRLYAAAAADSRDLAHETLDGIVTGQLTQLKKLSLRSEASEIQKQVRDAERSKDSVRLLQLLGRKTEIDRHIANLGAV
jgi:hypothetical protein